MYICYSDGASQSGVFCVAHSVIEKVKVDHEVDVFQYLRLLRSNRPQLVNTYVSLLSFLYPCLRYIMALRHTGHLQDIGK
jgi:hypothetical protein